MKKYIILLAMLSLVILPSCNTTKDKKTTTTKEVTVTKAETTAITESNTNVESANATTTNSPQNCAPKVFKLKEDIIEYYNQRANYAKANAKVCKIVNQEVNLLPGCEIVGPFSNKIKEKFNEANSVDNEVYSDRESILKNFPVAGQNYCSALKSSMVELASCYYDKGNYYIELHLKDDPKGTQNYSRTCMNVSDPKFIVDKIKLDLLKEKNIEATCKGCIIKATIDEKTGNITSLYYYMPTYLLVKVLGTYNNFGYYILQNWSIEY